MYFIVVFKYLNNVVLKYLKLRYNWDIPTVPILKSTVFAVNLITLNIA